MNSNAKDLTAQALEGFNSPDTDAVTPNPYLYSSPSWFAFEVGKYLFRTGRTSPHGVRMGRGYQVHANGMLFGFDARNAVVRVS